MAIPVFDSLGLKAKLIITMTTLFIISSLTLFIISQNAQKRLMLEVEDNIQDLTKAIQVSVQKMTSDDQIDQIKLRELFENFKKKGINEISILSENREILASSNPKKLGIVLTNQSQGTDFLIKAELGARSSFETVKEINIPIIIGNEHYGYINMVLHMDNFTRIQQKNFVMRIISTLIIFLVGTFLIIYMANKYTTPIQKIVDGTKQVSKEELITLPVGKGESPEIKDLIENFNEMVVKLRERKDLENRIKEMEHTFQIGQLSSAIAHEIKNPLNFMSLAIGQIKDEIQESSDTKVRDLNNMLVSLEDELKKINNMVTNFLEYGRPLKLAMGYTNLNDLIQDIIRLVGTKLEDLNISITLNVEGDMSILGDREKLSSCFLNLFLNSIDSIGENGGIAISMARSANAVEISFRDTGHGVAESIQDKIFEPYFSSKLTGMGLGLAFTRKILLEHGGNIWLNKGTADGAEFRLSLPVNL